MNRNTSGRKINNRYALRRRFHAIQQLASPCTPKPEKSAAAPQPDITAPPIPDSSAEEIRELRETIIRQRAEFENFRKRTQREKEQVRELASEGLLTRMLPVLDNLDRAIASAETAVDVESVRQGVSMISHQLTRALESEGLQQINPLNQPFDPSKHDALATEESADVPENHVCAVLLPGYTYKERLLRPAMVKVARRQA